MAEENIQWQEQPTQAPRRMMARRSAVYEHFTCFRDARGNDKARCSAQAPRTARAACGLMSGSARHGAAPEEEEPPPSARNRTQQAYHQHRPRLISCCSCHDPMDRRVVNLRRSWKLKPAETLLGWSRCMGTILRSWRTTTSGASCAASTLDSSCPRTIPSRSYVIASLMKQGMICSPG